MYPHLFDNLTAASPSNKVVSSAIAQYLGCSGEMPLSQGIAELEKRMEAIEAKEKLRVDSLSDDK